MPLFNQCSSEIISEIKMYGGSTPPDGWLLCNGAAISRTTYPYLFTVIGTTYGVGNGTTTFNLPDLRSRIPIGAGQTTFVSTFSYTSVNISTDIITVTSNDSLNTGSVVVLTTSGTAPTGLTASSTYYVIRVSATTIKLASSLANAIAGTSIDITGQGTGNHTLTITYSNRTLGSVGGEESHATTINEQPLHQHTIWSPTSNIANGTSASIGTELVKSYGDGAGSDRGNKTAPIGGSLAHNVLQPYIVVNYIIKY